MSNSNLGGNPFTTSLEGTGVPMLSKLRSIKNITRQCTVVVLVFRAGQNFLSTLFYYFDRIFMIFSGQPRIILVDKFLLNIMIILKFLSNNNSE